jgi:hypothetical protein
MAPRSVGKAAATADPCRRSFKHTTHAATAHARPHYSNSQLRRRLQGHCQIQCNKCSAVLTSVDNADFIDPAVRGPPEVEGIPALLPVHASIAAPGHSVEETNTNIMSATEDIMCLMKSKAYVVIAVLAPLCDVMMSCMAVLLCICGPNHKARRCTVISMPDACKTHT